MQQKIGDKKLRQYKFRFAVWFLHLTATQWDPVEAKILQLRTGAFGAKKNHRKQTDSDTDILTGIQNTQKCNAKYPKVSCILDVRNKEGLKMYSFWQLLLFLWQVFITQKYKYPQVQDLRS